MSSAEDFLARVAAYDVRCARDWDQRLRADPELTRLELAVARAARILVSEPNSSPIYAEAQAQDRRYRDRLRELHEARAAAKAPLL